MVFSWNTQIFHRVSEPLQGGNKHVALSNRDNIIINPMDHIERRQSLAQLPERARRLPELLVAIIRHSHELL